MSNKKFSAVFVGDMSFGEFPFCQGFGVRTVIEKNKPEFIFEEVSDLFKENDLVFGNLETVLSNNGEIKNSLKSMSMRGHPSALPIISKAGFNCLNVANNHIMQHGKTAFTDTVDALISKEIKVVGIQDKDGGCEPVIFESEGKKIAILGYAFEKERFYNNKPLYATGELGSIENDIKKIKPAVDVLIVSCHWGLEIIDHPSSYIVQTARTIVDFGVDIIIGHHPHVLQGIERYQNSLIVYSLGNFVFDMPWDKKFTESMILRIELSSNNSISYEIIPIKITEKFKPIPVTGEKSIQLKSKIDQLSSVISDVLQGDIEHKNLEYYRNYEKLLKKNRYKSYYYFIKNFKKYKKKFLIQQFYNSVRSRFEDLFKTNSTIIKKIK